MMTFIWILSAAGVGGIVFASAFRSLRSGIWSRTILFYVVFAAGLAAAAQLFVWHRAGVTVTPPDIAESGLSTPIASLSFSPFQRAENPEAGHAVDEESLENDLDRVAPYTRKIRLYSSSGGLERVPELARRRNMYVAAAAWISSNPKASVVELDAAIKISNDNYNVFALYVGNEALLREDVSVDQLIAFIRQAKARLNPRVQVSTGEPWHIWLKYPQLAREVDFLGVHLFPFWEGMSAAAAVDAALQRYEDMRAAFPGKKIVIAEFGWPSQGYNNKAAYPGPAFQAQVVRDFIREAKRRDIDYNINEAFDQPWKVAEGSVGPYWGIFDAKRVLKFPLEGQVEIDYGNFAYAGILIGILLTWIGLRHRKPTLAHAVLHALAANGFAAGIALALAYPFTSYLNAGTAIMWGTGIVMVVPLAVMTLTKVNEIGEVLLGRTPTRLIAPSNRELPPGERPLPMVSIHIPAYKEPPELLAATLEACSKLEYPNYEVLVVLNNTTDPSYWMPVSQCCRDMNQKLGKEVFKFIYLPKVKGFKAGALTLAYDFTAPEATILAVIDADYVVDKNWLRDLAPVFDNPKIALVQAPQDHRDGSESLFKSMMNWEYAGFFDIGMVQRNEDNAIIAHGTMLMLRRQAFDAVGGWSPATIVEDTELGLRLFEAGWEAAYTNQRYGWGVLPDTFAAFKTQRHRWAYGAVQIIKKHWRHMLPRSNTLTRIQKSQFIVGWMFWLSDALGVLIALLNLIWVPIIIFAGMTLPMMALTVPILTAFAVNFLHCLLLYRCRVGAALPAIIGAAFAAMSLQLAVANAVYTGLVKENLAFARTDKGGEAKNNKLRLGKKRKITENPVFFEFVIGFMLIIASASLFLTNKFEITEQSVFAATIAIQAVPFLAAVLLYWIEKSQGRLKAGPNRS